MPLLDWSYMFSYRELSIKLNYLQEYHHESHSQSLEPMNGLFCEQRRTKVARQFQSQVWHGSKQPWCMWQASGRKVPAKRCHLVSSGATRGSSEIHQRAGHQVDNRGLTTSAERRRQVVAKRAHGDSNIWRTVNTTPGHRGPGHSSIAGVHAGHHALASQLEGGPASSPFITQSGCGKWSGHPPVSRIWNAILEQVGLLLVAAPEAPHDCSSDHFTHSAAVQN